MIRIQNISVCFGEKYALKNLNCEIEQGDFIVIVGTNGAGKTTFFDTLTGTTKPTHGTITLDGTDITATSEQKRALLISRLLQNPLDNCVPTMSVAENIAIALCKGKVARFKPAITPRVHTIIKDIAPFVHLPAELLTHTAMSSLSGGQRQIIAFIMATLVKPRLLLLDEPTAALDPQAATKLLSFAIRYTKRHSLTTLLITHDPELALTIGNKIWVLNEGTIEKKFVEADKATLTPADLVGHLDYAALLREIEI